VGVHRLDQLDFLAAPPACDLLFTAGRRVWIDKAFVVHQPSQVVLTGESLNNLVRVFPDPARQVTGYPCLQHIGALAIDRDVDVEQFGFRIPFF